MLVAGAAAALLISASPAHAGVKFEKVQTKKVKSSATCTQKSTICQPKLLTCNPSTVESPPRAPVYLA